MVRNRIRNVYRNHNDVVEAQAVAASATVAEYSRRSASLGGGGDGANDGGSGSSSRWGFTATTPTYCCYISPITTIMLKR